MHPAVPLARERFDELSRWPLGFLGGTLLTHCLELEASHYLRWQLKCLVTDS